MLLVARGTPLVRFLLRPAGGVGMVVFWHRIGGLSQNRRVCEQNLLSLANSLRELKGCNFDVSDSV